MLTTPQVTEVLHDGLKFTSNAATVGLGVCASAAIFFTIGMVIREICISYNIDLSVVLTSLVFALAVYAGRKHKGKHRRMPKRDWTWKQNKALIEFFDEQVLIYRREHANLEYAF